jgi:superfamily II DNA helicase RecQ
LELLIRAMEQIFDCTPRPWQLKITEKLLEGHNDFGIGGTGAGKSLIFGMLAIATEFVNFKGVVLEVRVEESNNEVVGRTKPSLLDGSGGLV